MQLNVEVFKGVKISNCVVECLALKVLKNLKEVKLEQDPLHGNPASKYCYSQGGTGIILRDSEDRQYDFCEFKDGSMISSWDLYENR